MLVFLEGVRGGTATARGCGDAEAKGEEVRTDDSVLCYLKFVLGVTQLQRDSYNV